MNAKNFNALLWLAAVLALALALFALERGRAAREQWQAFPPPLARPLPPQLSRTSLTAALGDSARVAADMAYVDCLQYVGNNLNVMDGRFQQTEALYREVLWLDPGFQHAVLEGATVLGWVQKKTLVAQTYMMDAIRVNPANERMKLYYVALSYQQADDPHQVVETLRPEWTRPDAPEMLQRMIGSIYLKEKDWKDAIIYFSWLGRRAKEQLTRDAVQHGIARARAGLAAEGKKL